MRTQTKPIAGINPTTKMKLGATVLDATTVQFCVWAPQVDSLKVEIVGKGGKPIPLMSQAQGYWEGTIFDVREGSRYWYILNDTIRRPDPASRYQPEGVHGASEIIDHQNFPWTDHNWKGVPLTDFIIYELHTGTFTPAGTFDAIIPYLSYLRDQVGITAIELMPVAQFPGTRNWGYDGTYLFAPQNSYGGPDGLKRLVNACHTHGLAVIMDVVYNHLGPEGNYLNDFGPYFTDAYRTPWGNAVNYDGRESDPVRKFVLSNAIYWIREYHIDALRLDAIHGIHDFSAKHILQEISEVVHTEGQELGREVAVIAESDLNDARIITPTKTGGYGLDAQWNDDFHHALHSLLTGEHQGYYEDFGELDHLTTAFRKQFVYAGQYSSFRRRRHGNSAKQCLPSQFVVYAQNHDQIGNRAQGDRHGTLLSFEASKVALAAVLLSPYIPLLFMGEEFGERNPFLYFIDHGDPDLIDAVRKGRLGEFEAFGWGDPPDPYDSKTYERSRLTSRGRFDQNQTALLRWVHALSTLRKTMPALGTGSKNHVFEVQTYHPQNILTLFRTHGEKSSALVILSFNANPASITLPDSKALPWLVADSNSIDFGGNPEAQAPRTLPSLETGIRLKLPGYATWVYSNTKI